MVETLATNAMSDSIEPPIVYPFTTIPAPTHRPIAGGLLSAAAAGPYLLFGILFYRQWWRGLKSPSSLLPDERTSLSVYLALLCMLGMLIALPWMWKLFNLGRRMRQADAVDLLNRDHRAPVIFLRSFGDDELPDPTLIGMARTIEERLVKALALLGPVIAVGHPGERLVHLGSGTPLRADG